MLASRTIENEKSNIPAHFIETFVATENGDATNIQHYLDDNKYKKKELL